MDDLGESNKYSLSQQAQIFLRQPPNKISNERSKLLNGTTVDGRNPAPPYIEYTLYPQEPQDEKNVGAFQN